MLARSERMRCACDDASCSSRMMPEARSAAPTSAPPPLPAPGAASMLLKARSRSMTSVLGETATFSNVGGCVEVSRPPRASRGGPAASAATRGRGRGREVCQHTGSTAGCSAPGWLFHAVEKQCGGRAVRTCQPSQISSLGCSTGVLVLRSRLVSWQPNRAAHGTLPHTRSRHTAGGSPRAQPLIRGMFPARLSAKLRSRPSLEHRGRSVRHTPPRLPAHGKMSATMAETGSEAGSELRRLCVFCGSSMGTKPEYAQAATALGRCMVDEKLGLVYGGGTIGLMGVIAKTVRMHACAMSVPSVSRSRPTPCNRASKCPKECAKDR
eukprot:364270-Chlamydomonas_euryale.AAC.10